MSSEMVTCPSCGKQVPGFGHFCPECGYNLADVEAGRPASPSAAPESLASSAPAGLASDPDELMRLSPSSGDANATGPIAQSEPAPAGQPTQRVESPPAYTPAAQSPAPAYPRYSPPANPGYSPPVVPVNYSQRPVYAMGPQRDSTIALLLELLGYVGFLGIGHMYGGRVGRGVALLLIWAGYWVIAGVFAVTLLLLPVTCVMAILWPFVPIISGFWIKNELDKENAMTIQRY